MKIAVLGAAGQLGRDLVPQLPGEVVSLSRDDIDLAQPGTALAVLEAIRPDWVVNCAAYNFVDKAESEPHVAFAVNAWGVRALALVCDTIGARLVHFSTDYVFGQDTTRALPWSEAEAPGPISVYGLSKLTGEQFVQMTNPQHLVIRTCGLYGVWGTGGKGGNFVETMLRVAGQGKPLRVVSDQRCTPSFTADVAAATVQLMEAEATGLHHLTNGGDCSWFEFARTIFSLSGMTVDLTAIPSKEYPTPAKRPSFSVLDCSRLIRSGIVMRNWQEALAAYLDERTRRA